MNLRYEYKRVAVFVVIVLISIKNINAMFENFISNTLNSNNFNENAMSARPSFNSGQVVAKGLIQAKSIIEDLPGFRVYFEGKVAVSDDNGFYSFPVDDSDLTKYRLVITRRLQHVFDRQNTINGFKVIPDKDYICYTFKKIGRYGSWVKKVKPLNNKNFALPKNSIVLLMSPKYVDHIETWDMELPRNVVSLPKIVLRKDISEKDLKRVAAKSLLCLEDAVFHEKVGKHNDSCEQRNKKIKVTLP